MVNYRFNLKDPELIKLNLKNNYVLCNDQILNFNLDLGNPSYTYIWNPTPNMIAGTYIQISTAGSYNIQVYDNTWCKIADQTFNVGVQSNSNKPDFLMSTHAYMGEEIELFNTSPSQTASYTWNFPNNIKVLASDNLTATIKVDTLGSFPISLNYSYAGCKDSVTKELIITENPDPFKRQNEYIPFFKSAVVSPVPMTAGSCPSTSLQIELSESSDITVKLYDMMGNNMGTVATGVGMDSYNLSLPQNTFCNNAGVYMLLIESLKGHKVLKILVTP
jgi:hypothetical protein